MGINQIYFQRVWTWEVVWSQYGLQERERGINALDQIAWVKIMKKWNYIDIYREKLVFALCLLAPNAIHRCQTYITRILARGWRWGEGGMHGRKKRKIYVRYKCVNMSDTTFLRLLSLAQCCVFYFVHVAIFIWSEMLIKGDVNFSRGKWRQGMCAIKKLLSLTALSAFRSLTRFFNDIRPMSP